MVLSVVLVSGFECWLYACTCFSGYLRPLMLFLYSCRSMSSFTGGFWVWFLLVLYVVRSRAPSGSLWYFGSCLQSWFSFSLSVFSYLVQSLFVVEVLGSFVCVSMSVFMLGCVCLSGSVPFVSCIIFDEFLSN